MGLPDRMSARLHVQQAFRETLRMSSPLRENTAVLATRRVRCATLIPLAGVCEGCGGCREGSRTPKVRVRATIREKSDAVPVS
jgi:hypothetical protein